VGSWELRKCIESYLETCGVGVTKGDRSRVSTNGLFPQMDFFFVAGFVLASISLGLRLGPWVGFVWWDHNTYVL